MTFSIVSRNVVIAGAVALALSACGLHPTAPVTGQQLRSTVAQTQAVPPQSKFTVIEGTVTKILPDDNVGLPHQNFIIKDTKGRTMAVNHDTKFGKKVQSLTVGMTLTIRGVEYHDSKADGIHWTHHAKKAGDAGYILTADGTKFE